MSVVYRWNVQSGPHRRCQGARAKSGDLFPFPFPSPQNKKFPRPTSPPWKEAEKGSSESCPQVGTQPFVRGPARSFSVLRAPGHCPMCWKLNQGTLLTAAHGAGLWVSRLVAGAPSSLTPGTILGRPQLCAGYRVSRWPAPLLVMVTVLTLLSGQTPHAQCSRRLWVWLHSTCPEAQAHCLSQFCGQWGPGGASSVPVMLVGCSPGLERVAQRSGISRGQGSAWPLEWLCFSAHTVSGLSSYSE